MAEEAKIEVDPSTTSDNQDEKKTESSSVERETEEDLLAVVEKAMNPPKEAESHSEDEVKDGEQEEQQAETQAETLSEATEKDESSDKAEEEENAKLPFHNHPRFKKSSKNGKKLKSNLNWLERIKKSTGKLLLFLKQIILLPMKLLKVFK